MDAKKIVLLVVALVIAAGTAFMAKTMFSQAAAPQVQAAAVPQKPDGPEVLVATRALPVGTIIEADSFRFQPWPAELIENAYYLKEDDDNKTPLVGTVVRSAITAGQPITKGALVKPGDRGFLAAALGPGMRAVTVPVSDKTGVAGFVFPGDRVDLVLTQSVSGDVGPSLKASETIIRNIRVLAIDQQTVSEDDEGNKQARIRATVTLEATPRIAEKIAVAQTIGQLSLTLRSIADNSAELERAIAAGEVKVPEGADPKAEKKLLLQVASKPIDTNTTFVTGADVSRFQRRSVPQTISPRSGGYSRGGGMSGLGESTGPVVRIARGSSKQPEVVSVGSK